VGDVDEGPLRREKRTQLEAPFPHPNRRVSLTAQQPEVNIARTAIEALAASWRHPVAPHELHGRGLALPSEKAARIALRTQQVIAHETNVTNVADPLGGSWFVESLTDEMAAQAEAIFAEISAMGEARCSKAASRH